MTKSCLTAKGEFIFLKPNILFFIEKCDGFLIRDSVKERWFSNW